MKQFLIFAGLAAMCLFSCSDNEDIPVTPEFSVADVHIMVGKESANGLHTEYFPSRTCIGVGFVDTRDGLYDHSGKNFQNHRLISDGIENKQLWKYKDRPSFSGKMVAYYPYIEGLDDYSSIPVKVDGQTDYMYSGFQQSIGGKYNICMKHALTGFKVVIERGVYSNEGYVEYMDVVSDGLATEAVLDASTGKLTSLKGKGSHIKVNVGGYADEQALVFKFFAVPTGEKDNIDISIRIDGQDYNTSVSVKKPLQQDNFAFLHFVLEDDGLHLLRSGRTAWVSVMKDYEYEFMGDAEDEYIHQIEFKEEYTRKYMHRTNTDKFVGLIDWGDGCIEEHTTPISGPEHIYAEEGIYTVRMKGYMEALSNRMNYLDFGVNSDIVDVLHIGGGLGLKRMNSAFCGAEFEEIPVGLFRHCAKDIQSFDMAFMECRRLKNIPEDLFEGCISAESFDGTFLNCYSLESIPDKLFGDCPSAKSFNFTFMDCWKLKQIPETLFAGCPLVESFGKRNLEFTWGGTFAGCTALENIPEKLFEGCKEVKSFYSTFFGCEKLSSIPEGLFRNCSVATDFSNVFNGTDITRVPQGLFDGCTAAKDFSYAFSLCTHLKDLPDGLFDHCPEVLNFGGTFSSTSIGQLPAGIFDYNRKVTDFRSTFAECEHLTGESPYTMVGSTKVHLYERHLYGNEFAKPEFHEYCFWYGNALADYAQIPQGWK